MKICLKVKIMMSFLILLSFSFIACSNNTEDEFNTFGDYTYSECVYVNPLSSSTIGYLTELYSGNVTVSIQQEYFTISYLDSSLIHVDNPDYISLVVDTDIDNIINLNANDFLNAISFRFDIYLGEDFQGYTIFQNSTNIYLARIESIEENYFIWEIYQLNI